MALTDALCQSFFDLWHHLDPAGAGRFDPAAPAPAPVGFDEAGVRQHLAALRSLSFAVEELELSALDDEVDRTLLLDAIRGLEQRFAGGGPYRDNPAFWLLRLAETLEVRPDDPVVIQAIPSILATARHTLRTPSLPLVELALELGPEVRDLLDRSETDSEDRHRATSVLLEFDGFLRHELAPDPGPHAGALGGAGADWILHHRFGLEAGSAPALRALARRTEALEAELDRLAALVDPGRPWREIHRDRRPPAGDFGPAFDEDRDRAARLGLPVEPAVLRVGAMSRHQAMVAATASIRLEARGPLESERIAVETADGRAIDPRAVAARYGWTGAALALHLRADARSEIRRRYAAPGWVAGFGLFALDWLDRDGAFADPSTRLSVRAESLFAVLVAALDLAIHLKQLSPAEAEARLAARFPAGAERVRAAVRGASMEPLEAAGAALLALEWERLAERGRETPLRLVRLIARNGLLLPAVAGWRLDAP